MMNEQCTTYDTWPTMEQFERHCASFLPFLVKETNPVDVTRVCEQIANSCHDVVDISCIANEETDFSGDNIKRQLVNMPMSKFVKSFLASEKNESHWVYQSELKLYLAQTTLWSNDASFDKTSCIAALCEKFPLPELLNRQQCPSVQQINLWMNISPNCTSTLHYDAYHNLLAVYKGSKHVTLISAELTALLKPYPVHTESANHSLLSSIEVDELIKTFPENGVIQCNVRAGEMLFIPEGWWHQIASTSHTIAVSYWFDSILSVLLQHCPSEYVLRRVYSKSVTTMLEKQQGTCREGVSCNHRCSAVLGKKRKAAAELLADATNEKGTDKPAILMDEESAVNESNEAFLTTDTVSFDEMNHQQFAQWCFCQGCEKCIGEADEVKGSLSGASSSGTLLPDMDQFVSCSSVSIKRLWPTFSSQVYTCCYSFMLKSNYLCTLQVTW